MRMRDIMNVAETFVDSVNTLGDKSDFAKRDPDAVVISGDESEDYQSSGELVGESDDSEFNIIDVIMNDGADAPHLLDKFSMDFHSIADKLGEPNINGWGFSLRFIEHGGDSEDLADYTITTIGEGAWALHGPRIEANKAKQVAWEFLGI